MNIIADENIVLVAEAFGSLGDVMTMHGRSIDRAAVRDADILLVRTVTKVNETLLDGSNVKFVGSPTIGEDHVDKAYLASCGIGFASAPGSNAGSVADYVTSALVQLAKWREMDLRDKTLGIVGHGNVGKKVATRANALGMHCVLNDPPLQRVLVDVDYRDISEVQRCDIVTFHVPLTFQGPDATARMASTAFFERCKTGAIIINTSRGDVVDGAALRLALESGQIGAAVLDVWENEPVIDVNLLANCAIGTPHIAGYSYDGKVAGTSQVYRAVCEHLGMDATWDPAAYLSDEETARVDITELEDADDAVREAVHAVYDVRTDDKPLREVLTMPAEERGPHFDGLRKNYPRRREFHTATVNASADQTEAAAVLRGLGFQVAGVE